MNKSLIIFCLTVILSSCAKPQEQIKDNLRLIGGPCEGCEAVLEYGNKILLPADTLPGFTQAGQKLKVTGTIYESDGKTPAEDVILYVYHTNGNGIYATKGDETGWGKRHGYMRGWIKTGSDGKYSFFTTKPGSYPNGTAPAHIHATILEPDGGYYWIADYYFSDDPLLNNRERNPETPRGGLGVMELKTEGDMLLGVRDIVMGKNVRGYK